MDVRKPISVGARIGFAVIYQIKERLQGVDFPIELALPHRYRDWQEAAARFDQMLELLTLARVAVPTIHATQAPISSSDFPTWGAQTIQIAERLGAEAITVHPNRHKKDRSDHQFEALRHLKKLQHETNVFLAVETFGGKDRVLRPEEMIEQDVPMTLDVAHIGENKRILDIIDRHWRRIPVVHLSARARNYWGKQPNAPLSQDGRTEHHLPLDPFCIEVVRKLVGLGWSGAIVLEYLPHYHYRLRPDLKIVEEALRRDVAPEELPLPCDVYRGEAKMFGHNTPPPEEAAR